MGTFRGPKCAKVDEGDFLKTSDRIGCFPPSIRQRWSVWGRYGWDQSPRISSRCILAADHGVEAFLPVLYSWQRLLFFGTCGRCVFFACAFFCASRRTDFAICVQFLAVEWKKLRSTSFPERSIAYVRDRAHSTYYCHQKIRYAKDQQVSGRFCKENLR